jgi:Rieske Fe-S protein
VANFVPLRTDGGIARVDAGSGTPIAVVRVSASSYRAFSLVCPHAGTTVNVEANGFRCPNHGATFAANGNVTGGPAPTGLTELTATYNATAGTLTIG